MFCTNCGKQIPDGSQFCPECGARQDTYTPASSLKKPAGNENQKSIVVTFRIPHMGYLKWIMIGAAAIVLITAFMPVLKQTYTSFFSDKVGINLYKINELGHESYASTSVGMFLLAEISAVTTIVLELLKDKEEAASVFGICTFVFVFTLIYRLTLNVYEGNDSAGNATSVSYGPTVMLIFSMVLLVSGILYQVKKKKAAETGRSERKL